MIVWRATIRRELLVSLAILFVGALLFATVGLLAVLPVLESPGEAIGYILVLLVCDLVILFFFGRSLLDRAVLRPIDAMVRDTERIAGGEYGHRVGRVESEEFQRLAASVNAMAERLIHDQELLAENIRSLDETNRELTEARDQIIRTEKLASVGRLAAGIAHEIGNPLGAVIGYVDVAKARAARSGSDPELLDAIAGEARRIDRIVRGLLDFARPRDANPQLVDVWEVMHRCRELLERQGRLDGIGVEEQISDPISKVEADPHQLEQILVNLLLNAVDAVEGVANPRIVLHASMDEHRSTGLPARRRGDPPGVDYSHRRRFHYRSEFPREDPFREGQRVVKIVVADNGPGIPPDLIDGIFDPFVTTKEPGKGTGLGLAVCARLVDGMGGTIRARSVGSDGTSFTILLPAAAEAGARVPDAPAPSRGTVARTGESALESMRGRAGDQPADPLTR